MKRFVTEKEPLHLELEIIAVLNDVGISTSIAATKHNIALEYRDLPPDYQLSAGEFSTYRSFIISMASIVASYDFEIIDEYQSEESYSYYLTFTPKLNPGVLDNTERAVPMKRGTDLLLYVKIRLSNHFTPNGPIAQDSIARSIDAGRMFKEFVIAGITHKSINSAIIDLQSICQSLQDGDYSRLFEHPSLY